jgi:hypothetical protein
MTRTSASNGLRYDGDGVPKVPTKAWKNFMYKKIFQKFSYASGVEEFENRQVF